MSYQRNRSELAPFPPFAQVIHHLALNRRSTEAAVPIPENQLVLTKGDNNPVDDIALYRGLKYLERKHVVGKVRGYVSTLDVLGLVPLLNPKIQVLAICGLRHHRHGEFQYALAFSS